MQVIHIKTPYIKVTFEKIPFEFISRLVDDQSYLKWIDDSQVREKFLLSKYIKEKGIYQYCFLRTSTLQA